MHLEPECSPTEEPRAPWLTLIGMGDDGPAGLTPAARSLLDAAEVVYGGTRHLAMLCGSPGRKVAWPSPLTDGIADLLRERGRRAVVVASGDPFFYGIGATLLKHLPPSEMMCIPAPSAFSLAAARLGWPLQETTLLSVHGRPLERIRPALQPNTRALLLTSDGTTAQALAAMLQNLGFGPSRLTILENMGGAGEHVRSLHADGPLPDDIGALNTIAIEIRAEANARPLPLTSGVPDAYFEHDGQITKREIRAVTLSALAPLQGERLWDLGLGSGSVAIEWLLRHPTMQAIGVERDAARLQRAARNALALGAVALDGRLGAAENLLDDLPDPDAVFIGGGCTAPLIERVLARLRHGGRLVANAVTVETEMVLLAAHAQYGGELLRIALSRVEGVGQRLGWRPAMPVTQWSFRKP
jgi:precorrin-6Y C5,15-methyltransferase (decarboxylating)